MAEDLFGRGVYAVAFSFPVVPQGKARIRVQLSAAHTDDDVDRAVAAFVAARDAAGGRWARAGELGLPHMHLAVSEAIGSRSPAHWCCAA